MSRRLALFLVPLLVGTTSRLSADDGRVDLSRIPDRANALAVLDVESLLNSKVARERGWRADGLGAGDQTGGPPPLLTPADARRIVMGARLDLSTGLESEWEITDLVTLAGRKPPVHLIARLEGGYEDELEGVPVVWTRNDAYIVDLGGDELAMVHPADRQDVARWITFAKSNTASVVSPPLQEAAALVNSDTPFVLALDVRNALAWPVVLSAFSEFDSLSREERVDPESAARVASSLEGVTLTVRVTSTITARMRLEFGDSPSAILPVAKPLLLDVMNALGAPLEDVEGWRVQADGRALVFSGELSESGLRRLGSVLEPPTSRYDDAPPTVDVESEPTFEEMRDASKRYFAELEKLIFDIDRMLRTTKNDPALWLNRYATKIDRLPLLNVDEELLQYGAQVSASFRQLAQLRRGTRITAGVRKSNITASSVAYQTYYNGYTNPRVAYGFDPKIRATEAARAAARKQEDSKYYNARFEQFTGVMNELENVRKKMTTKYRAEFGSADPTRDAIRRRPS